MEVDNNEDLKMADKLFANFDIKNKKCFICDLDGTLYTGDTPIQPAIDFVINSSQEFDFYFLTNNTSRAPAEYVKKLNKFGITTNEEAILSPLHILVDLIKARGFPFCVVTVIKFCCHFSSFLFLATFKSEYSDWYEICFLPNI